MSIGATPDLPAGPAIANGGLSAFWRYFSANRGAVAGLVAGIIGDSRIFVSGGAEHQGPDGGGLIAVIASQDEG